MAYMVAVYQEANSHSRVGRYIRDGDVTAADVAQLCQQHEGAKRVLVRIKADGDKRSWWYAEVWYDGDPIGLDASVSDQ
jgi:hypothetical protein